jgi:ADP-ribose pyrophosphatase YjhB (NUDIX family)
VIVHVTEEVLAPLIESYGAPAELEWAGAVTEREYDLATYNPRRTHDVTLFILDPSDRLALIRKPQFAEGIWRPPGGGIKPGEDFVRGAEREALEETGLRVVLDRYLVRTHATFTYGGHELHWQTHVFSCLTGETELEPQDPAEIAAARWGTLAELGGPLRERLLATGHALWRYRVALHDDALRALATSPEPRSS